MNRLLGIFLFANFVIATPLIWHGASLLKSKQTLLQMNFSYGQVSLKYQDNSWHSLPDQQKTLQISPEMMFGYAPLKNLELKLALPIGYKKQNLNKAFGIGDLMLKIRYGVVSQPFLFTVASALNLPTSSKNTDLPIDDHTLDLGIGGYLGTKRYKNFTGDLRVGYWFNGKINDSTRLGNSLEYFLKIDYQNKPNLIPYLALFGEWQDKSKINNHPQLNTERTRHNLQLGLVAKLSPNFWLRGKFSLPIKTYSKFGSLAPFRLGLDFWVVR
jgi:hypothetical protein